MQALARGGRCAAPQGTSRPASTHPIQALCHGPSALLLQHHAQRQALVVASAKKRYQDFDSVDSLDLDSMDELDGKLGKYKDLLSPAALQQQAAAAPAQAPPAAQPSIGGRAPPRTGPPPPARAPASFSTFDDDFGFEDNWGATPAPPAGGGGGSGYYGGGGGYGSGYAAGSGYGGGGGYMNGDFGGGGYVGGGGGGYMQGGGAGGGYVGGGYGSAGGYLNDSGTYGATATRPRGGRPGMKVPNYDEFEDEYEPGEKPVIKVDKCFIGGKTLLCNHGITVKEVFLLAAGAERVALGAMPTSRAQALADEAKEDLLLINPDASPPVARIIKWGKYKYELEKTARDKKAKSTAMETKEVRLRPGTDSGDLAVKIKNCAKFLSKGDRVKLVMKFEGRELQFKEQGKEVLLNFISELAAVAKVEGPLNFKTGTYIIMLAPNKAA